MNAMPCTFVLALAYASALGSPASGQTPEERYSSWASPPHSAAVYAERRHALLDAVAAEGGGLFLVPSASGVTHGETFRQADDFMYFTGLELPSSMLALDADGGRVILFLPDRDPRFENPGRPNDFPGRPLGDDPAVAAAAGIERTAPTAELPDSLAAWVSRGRTLLLNPGGPTPVVRPSPGIFGTLEPEASLILHLMDTYPASHVESGYTALAHVRGRKDGLEIEAIRRAAGATTAAIRTTAAAIRPGVDERTLQGLFEAACRREGAQRIPFTPIVKSGPNSLWPWRVLAAHYDRRNRPVAPGDLVILDVGCEVDGYVSDVGRTFPVSGSFTPLQRRKLEMITAVSDAVIGAVRPGAMWSELTEVAYRAIPDDEERYMQTPSFFGHHIGTSTGDPVLTDEPLAPGMVFTVEPWYYNHDLGISVFVEDVVLVTETGVEVLTRGLPRSADSLARMVPNARR